MKKSFILITSLCFGMAAAAQNFNLANLVVFRAGDGTASIATNIAAPIILDEFTSQGTLVQSLALPTTTNGANRRILTSGTSTSEGQITRSVNGMYLLAVGYDAELGTVGTGTSSLSGAPIATTNRIIARIDNAKDINTTTAISELLTGNSRSCVSDDGINMWLVGGGGGIVYNTLGATSPSISLFNTISNIRTVNIFNNQLYISTASGTNRLATIGSGLPTTSGQTATPFNGITNTNLVSPYQFVMFDLDANIPGPDVLYVTDDGAGSNATPGIFKYSLVDGTWVNNGVVDATAGYRGLTGIANGNKVSLYEIKSSNTLIAIEDESGYNSNITATPATIATAPTGTAFRGVCFAPSATPLPLNLISFNANRVDNSFQIWWSTNNEINTASFEIELSTNGASFETVGILPTRNIAQLNSYKYSLTANKIFQYARLKMIDKNGIYSYSQILKIAASNNSTLLNVYPNPASNQIFVKHATASNPATIAVIDITGKTIVNTKVAAQSNTTVIDITHAPKGKYSLVYKESNQPQQSTSFIKQ